MIMHLPVRHSHLLGHCAVGAVVRGPHALMAVMDIRYWTDRNGHPAGRPLRYVDRFRAAFGITQELWEPPMAKEGVHGQVEGVCIPAKLFPRWGRCPVCNLLHFLPVLEKQDGLPRCQERDAHKCPPPRPRLAQVPYVLVHEEGYLDDVPWHYLAHDRKTQCRADSKKHYLRLSFDETGKAWLACGRCSSKKPMLGEAQEQSIKFMRPQPWLHDKVMIGPQPRILKVNEVGIHYVKISQALIIPPESRIRKGTVVDRIYSSIEKRRQLESCRSPLHMQSTLRRIAGELRCDVAVVEKAWKTIQDGYPLFGQSFNITPGQLREAEYKALTEIIPDVSDDEDFVTRHHTEQWRGLSEKMPAGSVEWCVVQAVDRVIAVHRLKEVRVLEGFSRIVDTGPVIRPDIAGESAWLPAVELFGEGLFVTLDQDKLLRWEKQPAIVGRTDAVMKRYQAIDDCINRELFQVTPRFLLLHTFAHLLIRQLESDAGYPASSLKERIFCSLGDIPMAGVLIYVAVADIAGSLGGIMSMAKPRRFLSLAAKAVAASRWCSLDPVCSEHEGQGLHLLNRAACHACLMIPEPSCGYRNALLDRVFVKGDPEKETPGFFDTGGY